MLRCSSFDAVFITFLVVILTKLEVVGVGVLSSGKLESSRIAEKELHHFRAKHWITAELRESLGLSVKKDSEYIDFAHLTELYRLFEEVLLSFGKRDNPFLTISQIFDASIGASDAASGLLAAAGLCLILAFVK